MRIRVTALLRVAAMVALMSLVVALAAHAAEHKYVGVAKCSMCHKAEAKGNQFGVWTKSAHAKAFEVLAGEKALKIAKDKGLAKAPQESDECLKCHVTGWGKPAAAFEPTFKKEEGVSCEACHGPGSDYKAIPVMKDKKASLAAGLVIPDEKLCVGCHNKESPTFTAFVFKEAVAKIAHPVPKAAAK